MNMKRLVFLLESPFSRRDYERFGIDVLLSEGFKVDIWDFTPLINPRLAVGFIPSDSIEYEGLRKFHNKGEALTAIRSLTNACVINLLFYSFRTYYLFKALSKVGIPYCIFVANTMPALISTKSGLLSRFTGQNKMNWNRLVNAIFTRIPRALFGITEPRFILAGGEKSVPVKYKNAKNTEIIWGHALDYDLFLLAGNGTKKPKLKTGVFMDQNLPFHPDLIRNNKAPLVSVGKYFTSLNEFFDLVETAYGVEIVIAAHPRSQYENDINYFQGRKVIKGRSLELIQDAQFVITHFSAGVHFPVLLNKPVLFITTEEIEQRKKHQVQVFASLFGKEAINIDEPLALNWDEALTVDKVKYKEHINQYIKKEGSIDKPFWEIVADRLQRLDSKIHNKDRGCIDGN